MSKAIKKVQYFCHIEIKVERLRIIKAVAFVLLFVTAMILNSEIFFEPLEGGEILVHKVRLPCYILLILGGASLSFAEFKLSESIRRTLSIEAVLWALPLLLTYLNEWINGGDLIKPEVAVMTRWFANILCCWLIFAVFMAIARRFFVAAALTSLLVLGFGIINYYVLAFRGTPILPWDYQAVGTAMTVSGSYEIILTNQVLLSVIFVFIFLRLLSMLKPNYEAEGVKGKIIGRAIPAVVAAALFIMILPYDLLTSLDINIFAWNQTRSAQITGVTAGFFGNLQFVLVEKPIGYSKNRIVKLKAEIEEMEEPKALGSPDKKPTIIAVMNESFADLQKIAGDRIQFSEDNMPYIRELMKSGNTISGEAYSSVFGGSTCDSEYEFLSGNSMSFFPVGSKPYQQYIDKNQTTLVSTLKSHGYDVLAVHPGVDTAWNRDKVYPYLGFEEFVHKDSFDVERELTRVYTSDKSCYEQVIFEYENKKNSDNPLFIFNITIQNHSGFEEDGFTSTVFVEDEEEEHLSVEQYMTLIKQSDDELKILIDYFEKEEEPVVIIFFGDHWPSLESDFIAKALGAESAVKLTKEQLMNRQEVPYFIWANYPLERNGEIPQKLSLNQLSPLLMRAAGLELTPYQKYLTYLSESLPVITAVGMIDANGNYYRPKEKSPYSGLLKDYSVLQYNSVFDESGKIYELFEPAAESG